MAIWCKLLSVMKHALELYDSLKDSFDYVCSNWLRLSLTDQTRFDAQVILAASSFLFDNLFAKENAGAELTQQAKEDLERSFQPSKLSSTATTLRLQMSGDEFQLGTSPFRSYVRWVAEEEPIILDAYKDLLGRLVFVTVEAIVNLIMENEKDVAQTLVSEYFFLNLTHVFYLEYRGLFGSKFSMQKSAPFFLDVEEQFETIRAQILD